MVAVDGAISCCLCVGRPVVGSRVLRIEVMLRSVDKMGSIRHRKSIYIRFTVMF